MAERECFCVDCGRSHVAPNLVRSAGDPCWPPLEDRLPVRQCSLPPWADIDSSESPVHGAQEQSAYNGHFESVCYHSLFVFNQDGDCLAATLRPGNVHSADGWDKTLLPIIERSQVRGQTVVVRAARPLPSRPSTRRWNSAAWPTPSGSRPTRSWSRPSRTCSRGPAAGRATLRWSATGASSTRFGTAEQVTSPGLTRPGGQGPSLTLPRRSHAQVAQVPTVGTLARASQGQRIVLSGHWGQVVLQPRPSGCAKH